MMVRGMVRGRRTRLATGTAGLSLLELVIALSIFTTLGLSLYTVVDSAKRSHQAVTHGVAENEKLRSSVSSLADELKSTSTGLMTIVELADGNDQITFQMPIEVAGEPVWGVEERELGESAEEWVRENWFVRYTVEPQQPDATGYVNRVLLRQVLDDAGDVQLEQTISEGLNTGTATNPGFTVTQVGDMWEVCFSTDGHATNTSGRKAVFHVATRN